MKSKLTLFTLLIHVHVLKVMKQKKIRLAWHLMELENLIALEQNIKPNLNKC